MFTFTIALVLLAHGIGHSMGLLQIFNVASVNPQWNGDSWLLTGPPARSAPWSWTWPSLRRRPGTAG